MFHDRQSESNFKFLLMNIIKFEKIYAELIAQGIDPSEFSAWLVSFNRRQPYAPPRSGLQAWPAFVYVYDEFESAAFYSDTQLSGVRIAKDLTLSTNMQICGCDALYAEEYAESCREQLLSYDELMLTVSQLPKINAVLEAANLSLIPITRSFWCKLEGKLEPVALCNGKICHEAAQNSGVLLKIP